MSMKRSTVHILGFCVLSSQRGRVDFHSVDKNQCEKS